jgi:hypothetical protein
VVTARRIVAEAISEVNWINDIKKQPTICAFMHVLAIYKDLLRVFSSSRIEEILCHGRGIQEVCLLYRFGIQDSLCPVNKLQPRKFYLGISGFVMMQNFNMVSKRGC